MLLSQPPGVRILPRQLVCGTSRAQKNEAIACESMYPWSDAAAYGRKSHLAPLPVIPGRRLLTVTGRLRPDAAGVAVCTVASWDRLSPQTLMKTLLHASITSRA
ncbi:hypothetical protein BV20DRAFT_345125 [Pilatotrama ljubarskyi]|nr:hypothetical protein BV20DRAFT_345125 [Pilatotrama ljubarskyi]